MIKIVKTTQAVPQCMYFPVLTKFMIFLWVYKIVTILVRHSVQNCHGDGQQGTMSWNIKANRQNISEPCITHLHGIK